MMRVLLELRRLFLWAGAAGGNRTWLEGLTGRGSGRSGALGRRLTRLRRARTTYTHTWWSATSNQRFIHYRSNVWNNVLYSVRMCSAPGARLGWVVCGPGWVYTNTHRWVQLHRFILRVRLKRCGTLVHVCGVVTPSRANAILLMTRSQISCRSSSTCSPIRGIELSITWPSHTHTHFKFN